MSLIVQLSIARVGYTVGLSIDYLNNYPRHVDVNRVTADDSHFSFFDIFISFWVKDLMIAAFYIFVPCLMSL